MEDQVGISADIDGVENAAEDTEKWLKKRYILAIMGFLGFANVYAMRVNLSVAIVAMVNSTTDGVGEEVSLVSWNSSLLGPLPIAAGNDSSDTCQDLNKSYNDSSYYSGEFDWSEKTQGIVLGSFFYGYVTTQIPGGRMAEVMGGRHVFGLGILLTGIFTLLSPPIARSSKLWGITPFVLLRVLEGFSEGVTFPSMMAIMAKWVPPLERSRFSGVVFAGAIFGTVISMPISGVLCDIDLPVYWWLLGPGGWPLAFYIFGALGIVWYIAWMALVSDSPASHKSICLKERYFIEWSLRQENGLSERQRHSDNSSANTPWLHIATSLPLWAALLTLWGQSWAFYTLLTELPTYMANMLHYDIKKNSFLSGLPYLFQWLCSLVFCWIADWLCSSGYLSNTASMKLFNSIGVVLPSLGLIGVAYAGCESTVILSLLVLNGAFVGATYAGVQINYLALSPRLAGTLYGITNCISNFSGFLAPYATGSIIEGHETLTRWKYVFLLSAGINIFGNIFYLFFGSGKVQPWDDPEYDSDRRHLLPASSETSESHSVPCDQENH